MEKLTGRVAAGEASEPVVKKRAVGLPADGGRDQGPAVGDVLSVSADDVLRNVGQIRVAARDHVRARLAEEVLHAVRDEPCGRNAEAQTQPSRYTNKDSASFLFFQCRDETRLELTVPLPELPPPDQRLGRPPTDRRPRHEKQAYQEDNDGRDDQRDDDQHGRRDLLLDMGVGDGEVEDRERAVEGADAVPTAGDACDCTVTQR